MPCSLGYDVHISEILTRKQAIQLDKLTEEMIYISFHVQFSRRCEVQMIQHGNREQVGPFVPLPTVEALVGFRKSTIYGLIREGRFPAPIRFSARAVRWDETKVRAWMAERAAEGGHHA